MHFPDFLALYARRGWTMFGSIDRVYDSSKVTRRLGFTCRTNFAAVLDALRRSGAKGDPSDAPWLNPAWTGPGNLAAS